jgi:cell division protease FtsH
MSEKLGPLAFGQREEMIFLGREIAQHKDYSEATAVTIDAEVRKFVDEAYDRAAKLLDENGDKLHKIAQALLERELLDGDEIDTLLSGGELEPPGGGGKAETPEEKGAAQASTKVRKDEPDEAPGPAGEEPTPSPA